MYYDDGIFVLERVFSDLSSLIDNELEINKKAIDSGFTILGHSWILEENPFYEIEKSFEIKEISKVRFRYKLELQYVK